MSPVRSRWAAVPLVLTLALPILSALPASAAAAVADHRGYLADTEDGPRYVVQDTADGRRVFTSYLDAVDGAIGHATEAGPTVVYVSEEETSTSYVDRVHVVRPGETDTVIYSAPAGVDVSEPALSPDGRTVAFAVDSETTSALHVADATTGAGRDLRRSGTNSYFGPSFSPDSSYLSWAEAYDSGSAIVLGRVATGIGTTIRQTGPATFFFDTAWSPDGTRLAVAVLDGAAEKEPSMQVMSIRGGGVRKVAVGSVDETRAVLYGEPTWAADGSAVYASRSTVVDEEGSDELVRIPTDGSGASAVPTAGYVGSPSVAAPSAMPDAVAPAAVSGLSGSSTGATAHITFDLPADDDLAEVVITQVAGAAADTPTSTIEIGRTRSVSFDFPLPAPGTDYGVSVFSRDWSGNLSPAAKIFLRSPEIVPVSLSVSATRVTYRTAVRLSGRVGGAGAGGQVLVLYARRAMTQSQVAVATATTAADGSYAFTYTPQWTAEYYVFFGGSADAYPVASPKRVVAVVPIVSLTLSASRTVVGRAVYLSGGVAPWHPGQLVSIQRYYSGAWRTIAQARLSSSSAYRFALKPGTRGTWPLRVVKGADNDHPLAVSPARNLYVG